MDVGAVTSVVAQVPIEALAAVSFVGLLAFDAYRSGTGRVTALAVSLPVSSALYALVPHTIGVSAVAAAIATPVLQLGVFIGIFVATFFLMHRMLAASFGIPSPFMLAAFGGLASLIILIVTILQTPPLLDTLHPSALLQAVFAEPFQLLWLLGAYLILAFVRS